MYIKAFLAKQFAKKIHKKTLKWSQNPIETQKKVFQSLLFQSKETLFGQNHNFFDIKNHTDFIKNVPIRDYEALKPYIDQVVKGEKDILWIGKPLYFAKTSGTTSGAKYIPLTKESMPFHIQAARNAILSYIHETGNANFVNGKMIFLQGSPILEEKTE
ncbi:GH3 auxin-responsive promoter [Flavobacterium psychrophilum]|nr:GH3 auxin-responsive promoter [Flavobacterium psychrophilum]